MTARGIPTTQWRLDGLIAIDVLPSGYGSRDELMLERCRTLLRGRVSSVTIRGSVSTFVFSAGITALCGRGM